MSGATPLSPAAVHYAGESAPSAVEGQHIVGNQNRWSRLSLSYKEMESNHWYELSFQLTWSPQEAEPVSGAFALMGVTFLADDGSNIDFSAVPGLARGEIDPFVTDVPGPASFATGASPPRSGTVRCCFFVPAPARQVVINLRSWQNIHPFHVSDIALRPFARHDDAGLSDELARAQARFGRPWRRLSLEPSWLRYALVPGHRLFVRGQLLSEEKDGALVRVVYRDAAGTILAPPYPETFATPEMGAFINLATHMQARRFTLDLVPPERAAVVELGFQAGSGASRIALVAPLEVSLDDSLLLDTFQDAADEGGRAVLERVLADMRDASSPWAPGMTDIGSLLEGLRVSDSFWFQKRLRILQSGEHGPWAAGQLQLDGFPAWDLPSEPDWQEDPFLSPAWRAAYHSLAWLTSLADEDGKAGVERALDLALSRCRAHPLSTMEEGPDTQQAGRLAERTEALLEILTKSHFLRKGAARKRETLLGEVVSHGFALAEALGQAAWPDLRDRVRAGCSLWTCASALPALPCADYWRSLALSDLTDAFETLPIIGGCFDEARLEIAMLGAILLHHGDDAPEAAPLKDALRSVVPQELLSAISLVDPSGQLPAFGDAGSDRRHASWIKRLILDEGRELVADQRIRHALSYPEGSRILHLPGTELLAARHYVSRQEWGYFCANIAGQQDPRGHFHGTSFALSLNGIHWIVDAGGAAGDLPDVPYRFITSSRAHNVALPDGREQTAGIGWLHARASLDGAEAFEIRTNFHGPDFRHRRIFVVLEDVRALAVLDHFLGHDAPLSWGGHLHFSPDIAVSLARRLLATAQRGAQRLAVVPYEVTGRFCGFESILGVDAAPGGMQGFVAGPSGHLEAAGTLRYRFTGRRSICGGVIIAADEESLQAMHARLADPALRPYLDPVSGMDTF